MVVIAQITDSIKKEKIQKTFHFPSYYHPDQVYDYFQKKADFEQVEIELSAEENEILEESRQIILN